MPKTARASIKCWAPTGTHCTWESRSACAHESELLDIPLPLESGGIDNTNRRRVEPNRVPKGVADDPLFTVGRHVRTLAGAAWPGQWLFAPAHSILTEHFPNETRKSTLRRLHAPYIGIHEDFFKRSCLPPPFREYVRTHAENRPGVYQMLGADGDPLFLTMIIESSSIVNTTS